MHGPPLVGAFEGEKIISPVERGRTVFEKRFLRGPVEAGAIDENRPGLVASIHLEIIRRESFPRKGSRASRPASASVLSLLYRFVEAGMGELPESVHLGIAGRVPERSHQLEREFRRLENEIVHFRFDLFGGGRHDAAPAAASH